MHTTILKYLLRLCEKLDIITYDNQKEFFNKRSEPLCKCRQDYTGTTPVMTLDSNFLE